MSTYLDELVSRAEEIALSYDRCRELIDAKAERLGAQTYSLRVDRATLKPGRLEVVLGMAFADGDRVEVLIDVDHGHVQYFKYDPRQMKV